jgi:signal transduction histidine kinase
MTPSLIALGQTDKAEKGLRTAIKALEVNKDTITLESLNIQLGDVMIAQKDYETAKSIFNKVAEWYGFKSMYLESAQVYEKLAEIYLKTQQTDEALNAGQKNLALCEKTRSKTAIADAHHLLYRIYKELGDFPSALYQHEAYFLLLDSVKTIDLRRRLSEERVKQNVEDLEDEKKRVERESALLLVRNRLYLTLGAMLLLVLIFGSYLYSQLRKTRKKLDRQNQKLTHLNQEKDKFFSIIAHDLRSPLAAFQGVGAQLKYCLEKGNFTMLDKISDMLTKSAANLSGLLDNLLSWALLNRGMIPYHPEPLNLHNTVADTFQIYENAAATKGIHLENKVLPDISVQADSNGLQAILRNLVGNAIKFTPAGHNGLVSVSSEVEADKISITVQDTGTGMSAEKLDKIFTLEKRSDRGTAGEKGAGLGLLLCKELVELHQGVLKVQSTEGKGTSFVFSMPSA